MKKKFLAWLMSLALVAALLPMPVAYADATYGWTDISANLPATAQGNTALSDMHFISDDEGWIVQGGTSYIYHTTDGGATWETLSTPTDATTGIKAIHMLSATEGYIAAQNFKIYRTTDGGQNWTALGSMGNTPTDIDIPQGSSTGYVCGFSGKIYQVTSGAIQSMATGLSATNFASISMLSGNEGWACGEQVIIHYANSEWKPDQSYPDATYNAVNMVNTTKGWAAGDGGVIAQTIDGINWSAQTNPDPSHRSLYDVFFLNQNEGWAVGFNGVVLHTANGGTNWSVEANGMTTNMMTAVQFTSTANGYALGNKGTLLKYGPLGGVTTPTVTTTSPATSITATGAMVAGNVTSDGGNAVTARGFVYGADANPALGGAGVTNVTAGSGTGVFNTALNGLSASSTYHVRAYAANGQGTAYGADVAFTTSAAPAYGWTDISANLPATAKGNTALLDMYFISANEGWIVQGVNSYIYHTTDGGATWETLSTPADATNGINAIHMLSATEGYIAAQNGKIFRTTDGGGSWTSLGSIGATPMDIDFAADSCNGYVCGENGKIFKITATGIASLPYQEITLTQNLQSVCAVDDDTAWCVASSYILKYDGVAWSQQECDNSGYQGIDMVNGSIGWAVGDPATIVKTTTGGETLDGWSSYQTCPATGESLRAIDAINENEACIIGGSGLILHTFDGGANWNIEAAGMSTRLLNAVHFTSSVNGYVLGNYGTLLKYGPVETPSTSGWTDISANLPATAQGITAFSDMHFISADEGWIVQGGTSYIYHTANGGNTWETLSTPADATNGINAIHMLDEDEGYIAAQNGKIYRTADGGDSWTNLGSMGGTPLDIDFAAGSDTGYVCGYGGRIYSVTSGGIQSMATGVVANLASISITSDGEGWTCGEQVILHYVSGAWTGDQSNPTESYNCIHMVSSTKGWAGGDNGVIINTTDGANWAYQTNPDTSNRTLNDIFFLNANDGWTVGNSGVVLHTTNGGTTWSIEADGMTTNMMRSVQFTGSNNGYALGNNGTLLKYGLLSGGATAPTVTTTTPATGITVTGATVAGNVTSDGGSSVTVTGFVYGSSANPAIGGAGVTNVTVGSGTGAFNTTLTGLTASSTYHVRAYATNGEGTSYGADVLFTTSAAPTAPTVTTTNPLTGISSSGATASGNVTSDGGSSITERGFVYGSTTNPVIGGAGVTKVAAPLGTGTGAYNVAISGLSASTTYHVRAYAINGQGSSYGADVEFTTSAGSGGGGGGGSSVTTPVQPTYKAEVKDGGATETLPVTVNTATNTGTASLDAAKARELFQSGAGAVITMPTVPGVTSYKLELPASALSRAQAVNPLTVKTSYGSVAIPGDMLSNVTGAENKMAGVTIGQGDTSGLTDVEKAAVGNHPLIQLTLTLGGVQKAWNNPAAPVTVTIPYTPTAAELENPESILIWYLDGSGKPVCVPSGHYDAATGTVTFTATHFSKYAVGYNLVSFNDVASGAWYHDAVSFIAARGIATGTGNGKYSPEAKLTRGEFIVLLMRAYGIAPDANPTDNFADAGSTYYTNYLAAAKRLGISSGTGNNMYAPGKKITRQEMFTLLYNALNIIGQLPEGTSGKTLSDFSDAGSISSWARDAMKRLVETGIVGGSGGKLSPTATTTRAEMAQVLYNLLTAK